MITAGSMGPASSLPGAAGPGVVPMAVMPGVSSAAPNPIPVNPYITRTRRYALVINDIGRLSVYITNRAAGSGQASGDRYD